MATIIVLLLCVKIICVGVCAYLYAQNRSLREWNQVLKEDRDLWRDKATVKSGIGLLGKEREPAKPPKNINPQPKVMLRGDLAKRFEEARAEAEDERVEQARPVTSPVDISVKSVTPPIVAKAREILEN